MVKTERSKELLELFQYEKVKGDVSYSSLMKKTGSNGKGFLDRYFVLHRNYVIYYKPGKGNSKPDDKQEPQGYINLRDCKYEETREQKEPLQFQIAHISRTYIIKAKDDSSKNQFLTLLRTRIKSLKSIVNVELLGDTKSILVRINVYKGKLPNPLILPDRVSPEKAKDWVKDMRDYNQIYQTADPFIRQVEQFAEYCKDKDVREYFDWFSGPEGPRLSMIRCEETVLTNWIEYINKTKSEIESYQDTRSFKEDYKDVVDHLNNMILLIDSYHDYMRTCKKNTKPVIDKYLAEKSLFQEYIERYNRVQSRSDFKLENDLEDGITANISCIGQKMYNSNSSVISSNKSSSKAMTVMVSTNNSSSSDFPNVDFSSIPILEFYTSPDNSIKENNEDNNNSDKQQQQPDEASVSLNSNSNSNSITTLEKWEYCNHSIYIPDNGREELDALNKNGSSSMYDLRWDYQNGKFKSKEMGVVNWNGKTWLWSHIKTNYKIRYEWNSSSQSFIFVPPKPRNGLCLSASTSSTSSTSSLSGSVKKSHPTTIYPDWQVNNNSLISISSDKSQPHFTSLNSNEKIPNSVLLLVAMTQHIQKSLDHIGLRNKFDTYNT